MRRLHLKFYLALVGTLLVFLASGAAVWHHLSSPQRDISGIEGSTGLAMAMIDDRKLAGAARNEVIDSLARQMHADVALLESHVPTPIYLKGDTFALDGPQLEETGWLLTRDGPVFSQRLGDGTFLAVHPRHRMLLHGLHLTLILAGIALTLALLTYPITRGITARLARLEAGVQQFGAGNLGARVRVEGKDEVAALARSFNESAEHIEQLVRAHKLLMANCSHELRTPLTRIRMAIERVSGADPMVADELKRNIAELDALIDEMLLSSRLDAASGLDRAESVDLLALVAEEAAHFDLEAEGKALVVSGEPALLRRLLRNLIENAQRHAGGATRIVIEEAGGVAQLVVEDAGRGLPEADRERIFEPFYRVPAPQGSQSTGVGLGLAIVRQIARAHGGNVVCEPREGGGSRLVVRLPMSRSPGQAPTQTPV